MLLVILGHTISGSTTNYEESFLYSVIWTLQMPMFFIVSGYVSHYSIAHFSNGGKNSLLQFLKKRTLAYLLPWIVWTLAIRGLILEENSFFKIRFLLWHMDSGYWFLVSLWTIVTIFGFAIYLSNYFQPKSLYVHISTVILFCILGMTGLAAIGYAVGFSFLCIKLTLFYFPFFLAGYIFGQIQNKLTTHIGNWTNWLGISSLAIWITIMIRYNFYKDDMTFGLIVLRYVSSLLGSLAVIVIVNQYVKRYMGISDFKIKGTLLRILNWIGIHSLAVYIVHYFSLNMIRLSMPPDYYEGWAIPIIALNYTICILVTVFLIKVIQLNPVLNKILFWK